VDAQLGVKVTAERCGSKWREPYSEVRSAIDHQIRAFLRREAGGKKRGRIGFTYKRILRRAMPINPTRPDPISIRLLGSGTAAVLTCKPDNRTSPLPALMTRLLT